MKKSVAVGVQFLELLATALCEDEVTRVAITSCDRLCAIGSLVIAIMTTETAIPVFMSNVVGMRAPVGLHLGEEIVAIDCLRFRNKRIGLRGVWIGRVQ